MYTNYLIHSLMTCLHGHDTDFYSFLYVTHVRPLLEVNSTIWIHTLVKVINLIESVQFNFMRRICPRGVPHNERLYVLKLNSRGKTRYFLSQNFII